MGSSEAQYWLVERKNFLSEKLQTCGLSKQEQNELWDLSRSPGAYRHRPYTFGITKRQSGTAYLDDLLGIE